MKIKTIASIVGARPQFIKAAPVSRALASEFKEIFIHTGQHYDYGMSEVFFTEMEMRPPDFNLGIGGGSHGEQTGKMLIELERIQHWRALLPLPRRRFRLLMWKQV
jgi:UDP-N-acetylglucosamine 2-epimerase